MNNGMRELGVDGTVASARMIWWHTGSKVCGWLDDRSYILGLWRAQNCFGPQREVSVVVLVIHALRASLLASLMVL